MNTKVRSFMYNSSVHRTLVKRAVVGLTLCAFWAGNLYLISAKTYDLVVKKNRLGVRVLFSI